MFAVLLAMACSSEPVNNPAPVKPEEAATPRSGELADRLGMSRLSRAELLPVLGEALDYEHHQVWPLSLQVFEDFRISGALYVPKSKGPHPGFLMAHGHFGEGKSSGEAQAPSHALAHQGHVVLALDTPGVEEGDAPSRQIHHEAGHENRQRLEKEGSSAMALQLHGLQAGLDYLQSRGDVSWLSAGGASGGAVQAFYLSQIDPRIEAVVLASFVPMPRLSREGGCPCDWIPGGWPRDLIAQHTIPSLWMSEGAEARPVGLLPLGLLAIARSVGLRPTVDAAFLARVLLTSISGRHIGCSCCRGCRAKATRPALPAGWCSESPLLHKSQYFHLFMNIIGGRKAPVQLNMFIVHFLSCWALAFEIIFFNQVSGFCRRPAEIAEHLDILIRKLK